VICAACNRTLASQCAHGRFRTQSENDQGERFSNRKTMAHNGLRTGA
jgi:hypothetical protein